MTKYLVVSYKQDNLSDVREFEHENDELDTGDPYDGRLGFPLGSNQRIIKVEDATPAMLAKLKESDYPQSVTDHQVG